MLCTEGGSVPRQNGCLKKHRLRIPRLVHYSGKVVRKVTVAASRLTQGAQQVSVRLLTRTTCGGIAN